MFAVGMLTAWNIDVSADDEKSVTNWDKIISIDPMKEDIGDFLKHDLNLFRFRAAESFRDGDYMTAAKYYLFILHHRMDAPVTLYNLACCYSQLGRADLAAKYLLLAFRFGFTDTAAVLADKDFDPVRGKSEFDKAEEQIRNLGRNLGDKIMLVTARIREGRIHLPENYDPSKSYPMIIGLHGYGDYAENFSTIWRNINKKDFIFLVPEAPYELKDISLNNPSFSWFMLTADRQTWEFTDSVTGNNIVQAAELVSSKLKISKIYLLGFSQGVSAAFMGAFNKPELFAGVIGMSGTFPGLQFFPEKNIEAFKKLQFFIVHGKNDGAVAFNHGLETKKILEGMGCKTSFFEFDGAHQIDAETLNKIIEIILNQDSVK